MAEQEENRQQRKTWWTIALLSILTTGLVIWYSLFLFDGIAMLNRDVNNALFIQATPGVSGSQVYQGEVDDMSYDGQDTSLSLHEDKASWYNGIIYTTPAQLEKPLHSSSLIQMLYEWSRLKLNDSH
ncbi:hypothetical protein [Paenibacillus sp. WLX2291]|uniref:hypothetical protein n=1 Tax=Paenibacillus sp. WLX2291 TaxID=3296934 RepID=UPI003984338B